MNDFTDYEIEDGDELDYLADRDIYEQLDIDENARQIDDFD